MAATLSPAPAALRPCAEFEAKYDMGHLLGKGGYGAVYSCTEKASGRRMACKVLHKSYVKENLGVETSKEVGIMKLLVDQHYGVVQLADSVEDDVHHYVVMEFCSGGSLLDVLKQHGAMPESSVRTVIGQVAAALAFCHSKRVLHLDIKPENIFLLDPASDALYRGSSCSPFSLASLQSSLDVRARLADFGMATILKPGRKVRGDVGSPHFKAPEIVSGNKFGLEVDVWSLGVVLCVMLTGAVPFLGTSNHDAAGLNESIRRGYINYGSTRWCNVTDAAKDLVKKMLEVEPSKRITAAEILGHPWFSTPQDVPVETEILPAVARKAAGVKEMTAPLSTVLRSKVAQVKASGVPSPSARVFRPAKATTRLQCAGPSFRAVAPTFGASLLLPSFAVL